MARLSEDVLEAGRQRLRDGDLDGFMAWAEAVPVSIDLAETRRIMGLALECGDSSRALRLFDAVWPQCDPVIETAKAVSVATAMLFGVAFLVAVFVAAILYFAEALT